MTFQQKKSKKCEVNLNLFRTDVITELSQPPGNRVPPVTLIILVTWLPRCADFNIFIVWGHCHFSLNYYLPHTEGIAIAILNKAFAVNCHSVLHSNNFTVNCPSFCPSHALDITWSRTPQKMEAPIDCQACVCCYRGLFFHWTLPWYWWYWQVWCLCLIAYIKI